MIEKRINRIRFIINRDIWKEDIMEVNKWIRVIEMNWIVLLKRVRDRERILRTNKLVYYRN